MNVMEKIEKAYLRTDLPNFRVGDTVRVYVKITEGEKERIQMIEGLVIRKRGEGTRSTFTVRKVSFNVGVERHFPLHAPSIDKIDVVRRNRVRRARLYYLRDLRGKAARLTEVKGAFSKKKAKVVVPEAAAVTE